MCYFGSSHGYWGGGGRGRERLHTVLKPVHDRVTVISLGHACLATGLLDNLSEGSAVNWSVLRELVHKKWGGSVERFLQDAARIDAGIEHADACAAQFAGAVIGWPGMEPDTPPKRNKIGVCPDVNLSLAILSRRVGDIFIASHVPDYSWPVLFDSAFEFDDTVCDAPLLSEQPWSRFKWRVRHGENR